MSSVERESKLHGSNVSVILNDSFMYRHTLHPTLEIYKTFFSNLYSNLQLHYPLNTLPPSTLTIYSHDIYIPPSHLYNLASTNPTTPTAPIHVPTFTASAAPVYSSIAIDAVAYPPTVAYDLTVFVVVTLDPTVVVSSCTSTGASDSGVKSGISAIEAPPVGTSASEALLGTNAADAPPDGISRRTILLGPGGVPRHVSSSKVAYCAASVFVHVPATSSATSRNSSSPQMQPRSEGLHLLSARAWKTMVCWAAG
jgi:hypothetical protein